MVCQDTCKRHYKNKGNIHHWDDHGYSKCITCKFTVKTTDIRCKCCGYRFRKSVRNSNALTYYYTVIRPQRIIENGSIQIRNRQQQKEKKRI
jgi:hypothetical protein